MKVKSPLGDIPLHPVRLKVSDGALVIEALLGTWPATISIYPSDLISLIRLFFWAILLAAGVIAMLVIFL